MYDDRIDVDYTSRKGKQPETWAPKSWDGESGSKMCKNNAFLWSTRQEWLKHAKSGDRSDDTRMSLHRIGEEKLEFS